MHEHLIANLAGKPRHATLQGREHLVVPLTMLVPGVLKGSQGPLLYPEDEVKRNPSMWNGVPLTVNHPQENGAPVSARVPHILESYGVGQVLNATFRDGKLVAEGWFDVQALQRIDSRILSAIVANRPVELSTGLSVTQERNAGEFNGKAYDSIARNFQPDHLAILPDTKGACSIEDGCGVLVNELDYQAYLDWKTREIEDMAEKLSEAKRKELIEGIVANCSCWSDEDKEVLNGFTDDKLTVLNAEILKSIATLNDAQKAADEARKPFEMDGTTFVFNVEVGQWEAQKKKEETPPVEIKKDEQTLQLNELTEEQFKKMMPESIRSSIENAQRIEQGQKDALIKQIVANENNPFTEDQLKAMSLTQLEPIAKLAGRPKQTQTQNLYVGSPGGAPVVVNEEDVDEPLPLPVMNLKEDK